MSIDEASFLSNSSSLSVTFKPSSNALENDAIIPLFLANAGPPFFS